MGKAPSFLDLATPPKSEEDQPDLQPFGPRSPSAFGDDLELLPERLRRWRRTVEDLARLEARCRELEQRIVRDPSAEVPGYRLPERSFDSSVLPDAGGADRTLAPIDRTALLRARELAQPGFVPLFDHRPRWRRPVYRFFWKILTTLQRLILRPQVIWNAETAKALSGLADRLDRSNEVIAAVARRTSENFEHAQHRDLVTREDAIANQELIQARVELELARFRLETANLQAELASRGSRSLRATADGRRAALDMTGAEEPESELATPDADELYLRFEQKFRGSQEEIERRQRPYLDVVKRSLNLNERTRFLDLGSGRGEWLRLLQAEGIEATGVDTNPRAVLACRREGLDAVQGDGLDHLRCTGDEEIDGISLFHILEHMEERSWTAMLQEAYRVLRPGGLLLVETPNPENLTVGAYSFWFDATHVRPIAYHVLFFVLQSIGFTDMELHRLRGEEPIEGPEDGPLAEVLDPMVKVYNRHFATGLDYAIHCRKP